jgi:hypothetical protein
MIDNPFIRRYMNRMTEKKETEGMADEHERSIVKNEISGCGDLPALRVDEWGLTGLSALLTFSPEAPVPEFGERRTGRDRRGGDRRAGEGEAPE